MFFTIKNPYLIYGLLKKKSDIHIIS